MFTLPKLKKIVGLMNMDYTFQALIEHDWSMVLVFLGITVVLVWLWPDKSKKSHLLSLQKQSVEIEPGVRTSAMSKDGNTVINHYDGVHTCYDAFLKGIAVSKNGPFFGYRDKSTRTYAWKSYREIYNLAQSFGSGLIMKGLKPEDTTNVGIYGRNSCEWGITAEGCSMFSMVLVPLYDTLGPDVCHFIINQTSMKVVVCENWTKSLLIIKEVIINSTLRLIVIINNDDIHNNISEVVKQIKVVADSGWISKTGSVSDHVLETAKSRNIEVLSFEELLQIGLRNLHPVVPPKPETVNLISYTSGTTGTPKGVVLTHRALMCNINGLGASDPFCKMIPTSEDTHFSYLPSAHGFERLNQILHMTVGAKIAFSSGDIQYLLEDIAAVRPTVFITVPRVLNRIYDKVQASLSKSRIKKFLFKFAVNRKMALLKRGVITRNTIWDKIFFYKIQEILGGRVRACISGSAPLSENVLNFARAAFGCFVYEGYGQTELGAATAVTLPYEYQSGIIGPPLPHCHIKLIDIPELDYWAADNKGEICIRSPSRMREYYKEPEKTKEVLDDDDFIHTGDVGQWMPSGALKIIDRKKHIFKLCQGEYLAPEKIENVYKNSPFVAQVFVDGKSTMNYPLAIVVPDEYLVSWSQKKLHITTWTKETYKRQDVRNAILEDMHHTGTRLGLKGFEQVKNIFLFPDGFTVDNGFLTPTMKPRRKELRNYFEKEFKAMYDLDPEQ